jgi:hypothetical protein
MPRLRKKSQTQNLLNEVHKEKRKLKLTKSTTNPQSLMIHLHSKTTKPPTTTPKKLQTPKMQTKTQVNKKVANNKQI